MNQIKKKSSRFNRVLIIIVLFFLCADNYAQSTSFLADGIDDYIRRSQLLGKLSIQSSLTNRSFIENYQLTDSVLHWNDQKKSGAGSLLQIQYSPLTITQQYNSHHPYGWNDDGMIPARGLQTLVSGGIYASVGHFSFQVKPEFVYAQNTAFETFPHEHYDIIWEHYYQWLNKSDIPEMFGTKPYTHFFPGQSSIRYNTGAVSVGVSTENLWWGPGTRNALVMSNNAPGFIHFTVNTVKPIQTNIGSFEGQIIGGSLSSSGILPPDRNRYDSTNQLIYIPKKEASRYIAGMVLSWQPKWIKGLFLGFTKAAYLYTSDISGIADIFPLEGIIKSSAEKNNKKAALGSLFIRYAMPGEKAELYIEYGRSDKSPTLINLANETGYPRAYVAGFRKLFPTKRNAYIEFASEFTQMQLPTADLIQSASSWYTHTYVRQGYTNNGQVIGAGIGPGSNSQMANISWVKNFIKVGLLFERVVHNNDFYYNTFVASAAANDFTRHWIDLSTTAHVDWQFKKFLLSSQMSLIRSLNYEWYIFPDLGYFRNGYDVLNFNAKISLAYRL